MPVTSLPIPELSADQVRHALSKIAFKASGCWNWKGRKGAGGYGELRINGKSWRAHRIVYAIFIGDPGCAMVLDHLCYNKACVNPRHLDPITSFENVTRSSYERMARRLETGPENKKYARGYRMKNPQPTA